MARVFVLSFPPDMANSVMAICSSFEEPVPELQWLLGELTKTRGEEQMRAFLRRMADHQNAPQITGLLGVGLALATQVYAKLSEAEEGKPHVSD